MRYVHDFLRVLGYHSALKTTAILALVVAVMVGCAFLGLDAAVNALARTTDRTLSILWSAPPMLLGLVMPALVPMVLLWRRGWTDREARIVLAAVLTALAVNLVLKGLTGRTAPEATLPVDLIERSQSFAFGLLEGGVWEGWPSGHAMTNTALAVGLCGAFPSRRVCVVAAGWAMWVLLAVVFGIQGEVHWLSDGIAGSALGWYFARGATAIR